MKKIVIIPAGGANFASIIFAFERLGAECKVSLSKNDINNASHVILPGVGHADAGMEILQTNDLIETIKKLTKPVLGICLGMQILFDYSEEKNTKCLGIIAGTIKRFDDKCVTVPQMGWNEINIINQNHLLNGVKDGSDFYFTHSYYAVRCQNTLAYTNYQTEICAVVKKDNFYGTQFHPEKSSKNGLQILENFLKLSYF